MNNVVALLGLSCLLGMAPAAPTRPTTSNPTRLLNRAVPAFEGQTLSGRRIDARYFRGKVTLLNFMYLGCAPCMAEAPMLQSLPAKVNSPDFQLLAIAPHTAQQLRDFNSNNTTLESRVRRHFQVDSIRYELLPECETKKPRPANSLGPACATISGKFRLDGYPLTLLVDRQGIIRKVYEGFAVAPSEQDGLAKVLLADVQVLLARQ